MSARALSAILVLALASLVLAWQLWLAPPAQVPRAIAAAMHLAPLLPTLVLLARGHRRFAFWGGLAALLLFSHGVMEAWAAPRVRVLALGEALLAVALVLAASWDGLRARFMRRRDV